MKCLVVPGECIAMVQVSVPPLVHPPTWQCRRMSSPSDCFCSRLPRAALLPCFNWCQPMAASRGEERIQ